VTLVIIPKMFRDDINMLTGTNCGIITSSAQYSFYTKPQYSIERRLMIVPATRGSRLTLITCSLLLFLIAAAAALPGGDTAINPQVYLNFNEGSGITALDASGNGNAGTIHNVSRGESGGCGGALVFNRLDNYVSIPYRTGNHPEKQITVSTWFLVDSFNPQDLISTYHNGGYSLGFADGNDLWWTVNLRGTGEVSVPVQHEGITPHQWHHVTATYDGKSSKIYLDGVLRNQLNASGQIAYETPNYVILGANAGAFDQPDPVCPRYLRGSLDEVRIYNQALPYNQIMDDRFRCSQELVAPTLEIPPLELRDTSCTTNSGTLQLRPGESVTRILTFTDRTMNGTWNLGMQPGSKLIVNVRDRYSQVYPDAWYVEIADNKGRIDRSIAFPNTNNAPVEGVVPTGNATVSIRYFDGKDRFPATVAVQFTTIAPPPLPAPPQNILSNPIIVIYSASWATLIALILVILWLHRRSKEKSLDETPREETKKD
jgi:hypothetical protein